MIYHLASVYFLLYILQRPPLNTHPWRQWFHKDSTKNSEQNRLGNLIVWKRAISERGVFSNTWLQFGTGIGPTLNLCPVAPLQLSILVEVTRTEWMDLCSIPFVLTFLCNHTEWWKDQWCVSCPSSIGCLTRWACLPVLQPRPDDGFIQLGNLPLQHRPQALSQAVVVLLQLLLVLFLVKRDQVLVLLNGLTTPAGQRAERRLK